MPPRDEPPDYRIVCEPDVRAVTGFDYEEAIFLPGVEELRRIWPDGRREWALRMPRAFTLEAFAVRPEDRRDDAGVELSTDLS